MKKARTKPTAAEEMLPEYDFTGKQGVRGKYYEAYREGHQVRIDREDGTVTTQYFTLEDGAVLLESDVREYFSNAEDVNRALRVLIALIPHKSIDEKTARDAATRHPATRSARH